MKKLEFSSEYFNATDVLECGQIFRFKPLNDGYMVFSADKACYIETEGDKTTVTVNDGDEDYFYRYFDCDTDYSLINARAISGGNDTLSRAAQIGKGVRILRQNSQEMLLSFLISQNNNIPRIKLIIERLCLALGEEKTFDKTVYHAFPSAKALAQSDEDFYKKAGLGYRAPYLVGLSRLVDGGLMDELSNLDGAALKKRLITIKGIGEKVADCAALFGFYRTDSFPVDVWIEKIYRDDFGGELTDRKKITAFFTEKFGADSGYFQQYLFYYKRTKEKEGKL